MEIVTSNKKLSEKYARVESKIQEQIKSKPGKNKESHLSQETLKLIEDRRNLIAKKKKKENIKNI